MARSFANYTFDMTNKLTLPSDELDFSARQHPGLIDSLSSLHFLDWLSLAVIIGAVYGLFSGWVWLRFRYLGVPQILWASPIVDCALAVIIVLAGLCFYRVLQRPMVLCAFLFFACMLVYTPIRVCAKFSLSRLAVIDISMVLAAFFTYLILRFLVPHRSWLWKGAALAVGIIGLLIVATDVRPNLLHAQALAQARSAGKNVVVIVVDTLRADHLSLAGYSRNTSPNLDRFAAGGVTFDSAIASSSWTLPSHASMFTGLYPHEHRAVTMEDRLSEDIPLVSEWFSEHGYQTGAFSANTYFFSRRAGFGRGFDVFRDCYPPFLTLLAATESGLRIREFLYRVHLSENLLGRVSGADITNEAIGWVGSARQPFFLVLNYMDAHDPYIPPAEYKGRYADPNFRLSGFGITLNDFPELTPYQVEQEVAMYDASIAYTDSQIHALLLALEHKDLLKDTVIVITSDHGEEFGEHDFYVHANALYYELVHVPLVIVSPGSVPRETRISTPVSLTSIPATLIDLATGQSSPKFPQPSLTQLWRDPARRNNWPAPASELAQLKVCDCFPNHDQSFRSITLGDWHYIAGSKGGEQLFKLSGDPTNLSNLAGSAPPDVLNRVRGDLDSLTR